MSTSSSVRPASRCASAVISRAYRHTLSITRRSDTPEGLEPEKGLLLAVLPRGADAEDELGELRELTRTALVVPVEELVQQRSRPDQKTYVGKGKLEELKTLYADCGADVLIVDDELDPTQQRALEDAPLDACRRSHAADPRHLRPARDQRRGKAAGRAGAARVQPAADARHVEASRAPRWRRRHPRPRRVTARERPPDGPAPHHGAPGPPQGSPGPARRAPQGTQAGGGADGGPRRVHERRQVDAAERPHGRRRLRREPPLRDARPDDARIRIRREAVPRHRHGRLHPPATDPARPGLRLDVGGDARRRSDPPRRRCVDPGGQDARADRRRRCRPHRDRGRRTADHPGAQQDRPTRSTRPAAHCETGFPRQCASPP